MKQEIKDKIENLNESYNSFVKTSENSNDGIDVQTVLDKFGRSLSIIKFLVKEIEEFENNNKYLPPPEEFIKMLRERGL